MQYLSHFQSLTGLANIYFYLELSIIFNIINIKAYLLFIKSIYEKILLLLYFTIQIFILKIFNEIMKSSIYCIIYLKLAYVMQPYLFTQILLLISLFLIVSSHYAHYMIYFILKDDYMFSQQQFIQQTILMNQRFLTNNSIIIIQYSQENTVYCMGSDSFIRSQLYFKINSHEQCFQNFLFYVEIINQNSGQSKSSIQFEKDIVLRHKISNKYLSYIVEYHDEDNDSLVKLQLSDKLSYFKIKPCFQYQIKISNKVKFNEDVYLVTSLQNSKEVYVSGKAKDKDTKQLFTILDLSMKSKLNLHSYHEIQRQSQTYSYGQIVWIKNIQNNNFLTVVKSAEQDEILFENINLSDQLQSINGLWLLEAVKRQNGGNLNYNQSFYLKNLYVQKYLSLNKNYQLVNKQKIYTLNLQNEPDQLSKFVFQSLRGEQTKIHKKSYLKFKNFTTSVFIGNRSNCKKNENLWKALTFNDFEDSDLYEIIAVQQEFQQFIRFVFSIGKQLQYIKTLLLKNQKIPLSKKQLIEIQHLFINTISQLKKLKNKEYFIQIQEQLGPFIKQFCSLIQLLKKRQFGQTQRNAIIRIVKIIYEILTILCQNYNQNQIITYHYIWIIVQDIFKEFGVQGLLCEIFRNNYNILFKLSDKIKQLNNNNLVYFILKKLQSFSLEKVHVNYWKKILQIFNVFKVFCRCKQQVIDINQRLCAEELFSNELLFNKIFIPIRTENQRIRILHPFRHKQIEIEQIKQEILVTIVQNIFFLFSILCQDKNLISKMIIDKYINSKLQGIHIIISYLNVPISQEFSNSLFSFITNCYIDSSPRINRQKPLALIMFAPSPQPNPHYSSFFQNQSHLLKEKLLNKPAIDYKDNQLLSMNKFSLSNLLNYQDSLQPNLNQTQLQYYKDKLKQKLKQENWSSYFLKSLHKLIQLECYDINEIIQIKDAISQYIPQTNIKKQIITPLFQILSTINVYSQELQFKKITAYLKYRFTLNYQKQLSSQEIKFLLPGSPQLKKIYGFNNNQKIQQQQEKSVTMMYREEFNMINSMISKLSLNPKIKKHIIDMFLSNKEEYQFVILSSMFKTLLDYNYSQYNIIKLLSRSIVITNDEIISFKEIFKTYLKLKSLIDISQYWMTSTEEGVKQYNQICNYITQFTNYFYGDYIFNSSLNDSIRKTSQININRQLLISNLQIHLNILKMIQNNSYKLQLSNSNKITKKQLKVFQFCFDFLYNFVFKCDQNIKILVQNIQILHQFIQLIQVGQIKLINLIYKSSPNLRKIIKSHYIEKIINKTIKNYQIGQGQTCQYNPEFLQFLLILSTQKQSPNKKNLQIIFTIIMKQNVFKKIFFFKQPFYKYQLEISALKFSNHPTLQVPLLYHAKMIKIINLIIEYLQISGRVMRRKIKETITINQLIKIIGLPDIYSHEGVEASANFVLKNVVIKLFNLCIEDGKEKDLNFLQSQYLYKLLIYYKSIFISKQSHKILSMQMEHYYPFLQQYQKDLNYYKHNQKDYFIYYIQPFLMKICNCLEHLYNKNDNKVYQLAKNIIQNTQVHQLSQNHLIKETIFGIDLISIKWRNFVDADTDNSIQQKFSKRFILQFLRHEETYKCLQEEQNIFLKQIEKQQENYLKILTKFMKLLAQEFNESFQFHQPFYVCHKMLQNLKLYFIKNITVSKTQTYQEYKNLLLNLLEFIIHENFQYNNTICRKIFYEVLCIFNFLLKNDEENYLLRTLFKIFTSSNSYYRFFASLQECMKQIFNRIDNCLSFQEINIALSQIVLCGEDRNLEVDKQSLIFLSNLCKHIPFTSFLRSQPYANSIDFLEKAYTTFYFIVRKQPNKIQLSTRTTDIIEPIIQFFMSMMNGFNSINQHFIIDSKFPDILIATLKLQSPSDYRNKGELAKRDRLIDELSQFYQSNGIQIKSLILQKISRLDFRTPYLLNRFKYTLLKLLYQSTVANKRNISKMKILVPIQLLKINLTQIYVEIKQANIQYSQENILRQRKDWTTILKATKINNTFLMIGFYIYQFIELTNEDQSKDGFEEQTQAFDQQKLKQNLIKKFFYTINQKKKKQQKLKLLQKQQYAEEIKLYYNNYYDAYNYFQDKIRYIQVNVYGNLIKVFFPKIPLCDKVNYKHIQKFKAEAVRVSHDQKIKSLTFFENETFQILVGEQNYFKNINEKSTILGKIIKIVKDEEDLFLLIWINSLIIVSLYILQDYNQPSHRFIQQLGKFIVPTNIRLLFILFFIVILMFLALLNLINLFLRKIPFFIILYSQKYQKSQQKQKQHESFKNSRFVYQLSNILSATFFDLYVVFFSFLSILHPLFTGFLLVYIVKRIQIGKLIIRAIQQTWFNLFVATGLLIVFNYIFAILIYSATFTDDIGYGNTCKTLARCLLMMVDQSLKADSGFLGTNEAQLQNLTIKVKVFAEILYILFAQKVIFQIFAGTIIDKFSQLRQKGQSTQLDEKQYCYICGQDRFQVDFQLEGFQQHIEHTHNKLNYIFYLFYLRRKSAEQYTIQQNFIKNSHKKNIFDWIPDGTSILKMSKTVQQNETDQNKQLQQYEKYCNQKLQEFKKLKNKVQNINSQLKEQNNYNDK